MPKISNRVSVYGDSTSISQQGSQPRAQRIAAFGSKFFGYNDCAYGGHSLNANYNQTVYRNLVMQNIPFSTYIGANDDSDIVVIHLGANDAPTGADGLLVPPSAANASAYLGCDALAIAGLVRNHVSTARAAGKRPVLVGMPYFNADRALAGGGVYAGSAEAVARGFTCRLALNNLAIRAISGIDGVPFIATYGHGGAGGHPPADYNSTWDGIHPTLAYSHAVSDYIAQQILTLLGL